MCVLGGLHPPPLSNINEQTGAVFLMVVHLICLRFLNLETKHFIYFYMDQMAVLLYKSG